MTARHQLLSELARGSAVDHRLSRKEALQQVVSCLERERHQSAARRPPLHQNGGSEARLDELKLEITSLLLRWRAV